MKSHKPVTYVGASLGLILAASMAFPACGTSNCHDHAQCGDDVGGGGTSVGGAAGNSPGGASGGHTAGSAGVGATGGALEGGAAGDAGAAGGPACDGQCGGKTPVCDAAANACVECVKGTDCKAPKPACDTTTNTCVECVGKGDCESPKPACDTAANKCVECIGKADCKDDAKPFCDTADAQCVACLKQADCTAATASACSAGSCVACTKDEQCSNITGKGVCDAGTCVQCTVAKESVCGGKSCNPATNNCTTTPLGTVNYCQPCVADSECIGGNQVDPDARCVPIKFMGTARPGGFCLKRVAKACVQPFGVPISTVSLSSATSEAYCGIDQTSTRCEAVLDLVASKDCPDGLATSCGCTRNKAGTCIDSGQGGLCKDVGAFTNKCTIPCTLGSQCPGTLTCPGGAKPYCQ